MYDYMRGYSKGRRDALREAADDAQLSLFYNSDTVARWLRARAAAEVGE